MLLANCCPSWCVTKLVFGMLVSLEAFAFHRQALSNVDKCLDSVSRSNQEEHRLQQVALKHNIK